MNMGSDHGECAFLAATRITNISCSKTSYCICEMRINRIVGAQMCKMKKR
jgi:hypothetical protein